ncbi:hypothetical protein GCM10023320_30410 [Pseudonocardia adelaidensis]|uniref:Uncharacterized protein n=1 Tax=Pseudonocardia adelaidensis TaxID=648754 RepID=A0ABP9NK01_9PSEU
MVGREDHRALPGHPLRAVDHRSVDEPGERTEQPAHEQMHGRGTSVGAAGFPIMEIRRQDHPDGGI